MNKASWRGYFTLCNWFHHCSHGPPCSPEQRANASPLTHTMASSTAVALGKKTHPDLALTISKFFPFWGRPIGTSPPAVLSIPSTLWMDGKYICQKHPPLLPLNSIRQSASWIVSASVAASQNPPCLERHQTHDAISSAALAEALGKSSILASLNTNKYKKASTSVEIKWHVQLHCACMCPHQSG